MSGETAALLFLAYFIVFGFLGYAVGSAKNAGNEGFLLGGLFGPLGILVTFALDNRNQCGRCGTRLDGKPEICPQCGSNVIDLEQQDQESLNAEEAYVRRVRAKRGQQ